MVKLWVKLLGCHDDNALSLVVKEDEIDDLDVSDLLKVHMPSLFNTEDRLPSFLRLYCPRRQPLLASKEKTSDETLAAEDSDETLFPLVVTEPLLDTHYTRLSNQMALDEVVTLLPTKRSILVLQLMDPPPSTSSAALPLNSAPVNSVPAAQKKIATASTNATRQTGPTRNGASSTNTTRPSSGSIGSFVRSTTASGGTSEKPAPTSAPLHRKVAATSSASVPAVRQASPRPNSRPSITTTPTRRAPAEKMGPTAANIPNQQPHKDTHIKKPPARHASPSVVRHPLSANTTHKDAEMIQEHQHVALAEASRAGMLPPLPEASPQRTPNQNAASDAIEPSATNAARIASASVVESVHGSRSSSPATSEHLEGSRRRSFHGVPESSTNSTVNTSRKEKKVSLDGGTSTTKTSVALTRPKSSSTSSRMSTSASGTARGIVNGSAPMSRMNTSTSCAANTTAGSSNISGVATQNGTSSQQPHRLHLSQQHLDTVCDVFKPQWGKATCATCNHAKLAHNLKEREQRRGVSHTAKGSPAIEDQTATLITLESDPSSSVAAARSPSPHRAAASKSSHHRGGSTPLHDESTSKKNSKTISQTHSISAVGKTQRSTSTARTIPTPTTPSRGLAVQQTNGTAAASPLPARPPMSASRATPTRAATPTKDSVAKGRTETPTRKELSAIPQISSVGRSIRAGSPMKPPLTVRPPTNTKISSPKRKEGAKREVMALKVEDGDDLITTIPTSPTSRRPSTTVIMEIDTTGEPPTPNEIEELQAPSPAQPATSEGSEGQGGDDDDDTCGTVWDMPSDDPTTMAGQPVSSMTSNCNPTILTPPLSARRVNSCLQRHLETRAASSMRQGGLSSRQASPSLSRNRSPQRVNDNLNERGEPLVISSGDGVVVSKGNTPSKAASTTDTNINSMCEMSCDSGAATEPVTINSVLQQLNIPAPLPLDEEAALADKAKPLRLAGTPAPTVLPRTTSPPSEEINNSSLFNSPVVNNSILLLEQTLTTPRVGTTVHTTTVIEGINENKDQGIFDSPLGNPSDNVHPPATPPPPAPEVLEKLHQQELAVLDAEARLEVESGNDVASGVLTEELPTSDQVVATEETAPVPLDPFAEFISKNATEPQTMEPTKDNSADVNSDEDDPFGYLYEDEEATHAAQSPTAKTINAEAEVENICSPPLPLPPLAPTVPSFVGVPTVASPTEEEPIDGLVEVGDPLAAQDNSVEVPTERPDRAVAMTRTGSTVRRSASTSSAGNKRASSSSRQGWGMASRHHTEMRSGGGSALFGSPEINRDIDTSIHGATRLTPRGTRQQNKQNSTPPSTPLKTGALTQEEPSASSTPENFFQEF